jgi:hypothetical protein
MDLHDWEHVESGGLFTNHLRLRGMTSLGSVFDRVGTPSLLQTGGFYQGGYIHDRQHPHDLVMEASATFAQGPLFAYIAPVGSPALGPMSWMHRSSAIADPVAPIGQHWQDATHVSYGVATLGARAKGVLLEGSAFNARESDSGDPWPDFSHGRLDSFSGRATLGGARASLSSWYGYLKHHDLMYPAMQMHRYGASAAFNGAGVRGGAWSSLAVWGMNVHHHDSSSHVLMHADPNTSPHARSSSVLVESSLGLGMRQNVFARAERVMKNGEELGFQGGDLMALYDIRTVALGGRRNITSTRVGILGAGARLAATFLPSTLELTYGTRRPLGVDVFIQARSR